MLPISKKNDIGYTFLELPACAGYCQSGKNRQLVHFILNLIRRRVMNWLSDHHLQTCFRTDCSFTAIAIRIIETKCWWAQGSPLKIVIWRSFIRVHLLHQDSEKLLGAVWVSIIRTALIRTVALVRIRLFIKRFSDNLIKSIDLQGFKTITRQKQAFRGQRLITKG